MGGFATVRGGRRRSAGQKEFQLNNASGSAVLSYREALRSGRLARRLAELEDSAREHMSWIGAVAVISVAVLAFEFAFPLKVEAAAMRATVETIMTLFALAAAWLVRAQFTQSGRLRDLLLVAALVTVGLVHLCWQAVPAALDLQSARLFAAAAEIGTLLVAAIFALAAAAGPQRVVTNASRPLTRPAVISLAVIVVSGLIAVAAQGELVAGADSAHGVAGAIDHPLVLVVALLSAGMLTAGGVRFLRRGRRERDGAAPLLAAGLIGLAATTLSHIALNTVPADRLSPRDAVTLVAISLLLAAAIRQELRVRATLSRAAALAERQRMARDLHDSLAQDLAFIAAHGERIAGEMGQRHPVVIAARRALAVSRQAIAELSCPADLTVQESLEVLAHELRERFEVSIAVDVDAAADDLSLRTQEDLSWITREAIANAARHGGAKNVTVSLTRTPGAHILCIRDDGCGIGNAERVASHQGFGLRSMRERAEAAGGRMTVRKLPKRGTVLEVVLP
jgi:signal transduction histidine kinase